jgi:hypothetical protein
LALVPIEIDTIENLMAQPSLSDAQLKLSGTTKSPRP